MAPLRALTAAILLFFAVLAAAKADTPTSYSQMVARLNQDCAQSALIRVASLGKSGSGDRTIWMVRLADPDALAARRELILCRQHGDEPVSTEAALGFLDDLAAGKRPDIEKELKRVTVYIVPMVNPDGADAGTRSTSHGADLNRDWGPFHEPETREVYAAFRQIHPNMVLDMHSWDEGDPFRGYCLEGPRAGVPGDPQIAQATRDLQQRGVAKLLGTTGQEVAVTNYGIEADSTLCHRFFLEQGGVASLLFETQPDDAGQSFDRRVAVAQAAIVWLVGDLANQSVWKQIASRETKITARPANFKIASAGKLVFTGSASEDAEPQSHLPFGAAVRLVRSAARRVPAPVWWALGIYILLCAARPIFAPKNSSATGDGETPLRRYRRRRSVRSTEKGRSLRGT